MTDRSTNVRSRNLWPWVVGLNAVLAACFVVALWGVRIERTDPSSAAENAASLWWYWIGYGGLWVALSTAVWGLYSRRDLTPSCDGRAAAALIVAVAIVARLAVVYNTTPQLSDDIWRYIHDGRQVAQGINPYRHAPAELRATLPDDPILPKINHPDLVTIYLPTSQAVFALLWKAHPPRLDPLADKTFRAGFVAIDVLIVFLLIAMLRRAGRSTWWAIAYAWHPLVISEVAASGHQDVIGIALLLGFVALAGSANPSTVRLAAAVAILAAAGLVKPIVLPVVIPVLWGLRATPRRLVACALAGVGTATLLWVPFLCEPAATGRLLDTAGAFTGTWSFNSSVHGPLAYLTGSATLAGSIVGVILVGLMAGCIRHGCGVARSAQVFLFASLLLSSTVHPWYLLWALAFVPLYFDPPVWVFSLTIGWSYVVLRDPSRWHLPVSVVVLEYLPVYVALGLWVVSERLRGGPQRPAINPPINPVDK